MAQYGYAGLILRVDLNTGTVREEPTAPYAGRFLGGRGIAAKIYWDEVPPSVGALDPKNRLIFALGPLAGVPAVGASRWGVFGKSPQPSPESFCYGNLGGSFGAELRFAGFDALVIQGAALVPSVIVIEDRSVRIVEAGELAGMGAIAARDAVRARLGAGLKVAAIGPAGEKCVTNAIILAEGDASCSGGLGAVMGSKNLKAVAVRGTKRKTPVADPVRLRAIADEIRAIERGNTKVWGLDFMAHGPRTKKSPCYGCMCHCLRVNYHDDNGASGKFMCQSRFFYFVHALIHYGAENDVPFQANKLCDDYGIDTWELQKIMDWLLQCHAAGLVTAEDTGIPFATIGSIEFIETLVRMIAARQGFGDVLGRGLERAAESLGAAALALVVPADPYEPRLYNTNALIFPFEPREPIQQVHEVGLTMAQWASWAKGTAGAHISTEVLRGIAEKFWGGRSAADLSTLDGKALAARLIQDRQYTKECLMLCDWMYPVLDKPRGEDHVGDPTVESRLFSAVMGVETDESALNRYGERVFNLQRAILLREGHRARLDDYLPAQWHDEPLAGHVADPDCTAPGADGSIISRKGAVIDRPSFEKMRDEYYRLREWDEATGLQKQGSLANLDLTDVADDLSARGLLA